MSTARVGVERPALRVEHDVALEAHPGPALGRGTRRQQLVGDAGRGQLPGEPGDVAAGPEVEAAVHPQQRVPRLGRHAVPQLERGAGERDVERVAVAAPHDAGTAVRGPEAMPGFVLLEHHGGHAAPGQRPGRRRAHQAGADDHHRPISVHRRRLSSGG